MKVLVAEDDIAAANLYEEALSQRGHEVIVTHDGLQCLETYAKIKSENSDPDRCPFDAIILDYAMPRINGLQAAKKILSVDPRERIIFASAYVIDTLSNSVSELGRVVELVQKPFEMDAFVDLIEDVGVTKELEKLNVNVKEIKSMQPTHQQLKDLLSGLKKIQKGRAL
jgi:CheY-like chemotaxis protein